MEPISNPKREEIKIDDITYEIKTDTSPGIGNKKYYIRAGFPYQYITDNMTYAQVCKVAKSMRQLGFTVK